MSEISAASIIHRTNEKEYITGYWQKRSTGFANLRKAEHTISSSNSLMNSENGLLAGKAYIKLKNGETVSCAATPAPHCEVLEICKDILAAKGITLDIQEYDDYIIPNNVVEDGTVDTNYFQHQPYLDDFNTEHGTHLVTVAGIHVEPMGIYGGKQDSLAPIEG